MNETHALQVENRALILPYSQKQRENAHLNDARMRSRVPVYALLTGITKSGLSRVNQRTEITRVRSIFSKKGLDTAQGSPECHTRAWWPASMKS